jgi:putative ABC transport system permease protein
MIKSYLKVGWRNLLRNQAYSLINITGLAMGMTIAMFIGFWIYDELSFNRYHKNYSRIAQLWNGVTDPATSEIQGALAMQYPVAPTLKSNYPQYFKHIVIAGWINDYPITFGENKFSRIGQFIEPQGLELLSIKMVKGNYKSLDDAHSIILSESAAAAMFGDQDPINKTLRISNEMDVQITGIYEDIPRNSAFGTVEFFAPWSLWALSHPWIKNAETDWDNRQFCAYVEIQPDVSFEQVNAAIKDLYKKYVPADFYTTIEKYAPFAQLVPMSTWHLYSEFEDGKPAKGRITFVWLFGIIGVFVLLLACINFVNLSTARSERRAKEVGVRKSIGSDKKQLVIQFLSESFVIVALSFILSLILLGLFLQPFNQLADKDIQLPLANLFYWMIAIGFVIVTSLMAGMYPAFYLSSFQPVKVLKGKLGTGRSAALPRQVLVVLQFTVSVTLIIGTIVVYEQVQFARNRPVGYNKDGLITVRMNDPTIRQNINTLKTELLNSGAVHAVALSSSPLTEIWNITGGYNWRGKDPNFEGEFVMCLINPDYGKAINWNIVEGRDFSEDIPTDTIDAIIINRAAANYMGLENPVGQQLIDVDEYGAFKWSKTIIGVVDDVVMSSPYKPVMQTIYYYRPEMFSHIQIRINPTQSASEALPKIKTVFDKVAPTTLFEYSFVDEVYGQKFGQEVRVGKLAGVFSFLAIVISCLGLFGLASFVAEQRTKEIGIRKVMGASVTTLWKMLTKDFALLVVISCVIAVPIGYYLMNSWLQKYEYRTEISIWVFVTTCASAIVITLMTVSYQSIKAANINPVESLRAE